MLKARNELATLKPYVPGKPIEDVMREFGLTEVIKLASNENPLGCSPVAKEAIVKHLDNLNLYPDGNCTSLKEKIAGIYSVSPSEVSFSSGSDEMCDLLSKTFLDHGDEVIMADITFPRYISTSVMMGAVPVIVPLKDFTFDIKGMADKVTDKTKLIWICNPNNPTGTMVPTSEIIELLDSVSEDVLVVLDEAYREFVTRDDYMMDSENLLSKYHNLVIMRTFSKAYGLAALRVGYILAASSIVTEIDKIRGPFNVNSLAQVAAYAALDDQDFIKKSYDVNKEGKEYIYKEFDAMNVPYAKSETNHIFFGVEKDAFSIFDALQRAGVIVRPMGAKHLRVSIGTMEQNKRFIELIKDML